MNLTHIRILLASVLIAITFIATFAAFAAGVRPESVSKYATEHVGSIFSGLDTGLKSEPQEPLAYMTLLSSTVANTSDPEIEDDKYFVATRLLAYQLIHQNHTKSRKNIPFVVMVTEDVSEEKRERLRRDGATVAPVDFVTVGEDWIHPQESRWMTIMAKLRGWQMTQYSRILFLDNDMIINQCMDDIFDDPAAQFRPVSTNITKEEPEDMMLHSKYMMACSFEVTPRHKYPPDPSKGDSFHGSNYFNAGFFLFSPSTELFDYYMSLSRTKGRWNPNFMEQNLLNYAHKRGGAVPWQQIAVTWNVRFSYWTDYEQGVASMHEKWWDQQLHDSRLHDYFWGLKWKMEGFYEAWDLAHPV